MDPSTSTSNGGGGPSSAAAQAQAAHLAKLLKDPSKPVHIPSGPREKSIRPPQEMMKNVMGSSAGAGSGEFHVYKQSRRREYERLRLMDEQDAKEKAQQEAEERRAAIDAETEAKTAKNRAKRQKRKDRGKQHAQASKPAASHSSQAQADGEDAPVQEFKKRKLAASDFAVQQEDSGARPEGGEEEEEQQPGAKPAEDSAEAEESGTAPQAPAASSLSIVDAD